MSDTRPEQHLDLDLLADVLAGEAPSGADDHLAGCADCRAALDDLRAAQARVSEELAALPAVPLPADIAERLRDALDAEDPAAADAPATTGATTVTPFPTAQERANPARWLAVAAAVVVLLVGGLFGVSQLRDDSGGSTTAAGSDAGAKASSELAVVRNNSGTDYTDRASLSAALPGLLGGERAADSMVAAPAPAAPQQGAGANTLAAPDPLAPLRDTKGLADCLLALLPPDDPSVQPLAVDYATFKGQPAMVVVLPGSVADKLDVFVVGPGCSRANDSVLFYTSVDKP